MIPEKLKNRLFELLQKGIVSGRKVRGGRKLRGQRGGLGGLAAGDGVLERKTTGDRNATGGKRCQILQQLATR